jgi:LacI family transcriptional regulator
MLATALGLPDPCIELARARNIPYVLINRGLPGLASVVPDNAMGIGLVLNHLRGLGHRRIGYVSGFAHLIADTVRSECFELHMRAAGLDADLVEQAHSFDRAGGLAATRALLARAPEMTALVCGNDLIAAGAYDAAREMGISVPDRLSITGFNDLPLMDLMAPPLTTVRVDFHRMGERAAEILLAELDQRSEPGAPRAMEAMLAELVVRGSTAPAPPAMAFVPSMAAGLAQPSVAS